MNRLHNQVAIVTGSAAGIGRAVAELFAEEGAKVVVTDIDATAGAETVSIITKKGGNAIFIQVDISKEAECAKVVNEAHSHYGRIDILVNNAAIFVLKTVSDATPEDWQRSFGINVFGMAFMTKHVIEKMKLNNDSNNSKGGSIVNIASISSFIAQPNLATYSATKAAIISLTRNTALDVAKFNIRVNAVCPGPILTEATHRHAKSVGMDIEEIKKEMVGFCCLNRMGEPREVATAVLYLASREASYITGTHLMVDGGYTLV